MCLRSSQKAVETCAHAYDWPLELAELNTLAFQSLQALWDQKEQLFSRSILWKDQEYRRSRASQTGSIIALLGLRCLKGSGAELGFEPGAIEEAILQDTAWVKGVGDLGLLLWFTASCVPERLSAVLHEFDLCAALESRADSRQGFTQLLAFFLAGIAHAKCAVGRTHIDLTDVAVAAYHKLLRNQSESGLFRHVAFPWGIREIFGRRVGTFADQMFAVYALTKFAQSFAIEEPLQSALNCANAVCDLQGELGQWWYLYDVRRGRVASRYPVYSAHQDGAGPIALLALEEATRQSFRGAVWNGLSWIAANNELGVDLRSSNRGFMADAIEAPSGITSCLDTAASCLGVTRAPVTKKLTIRYEARVDHFGWLLYAFGKFGLSNQPISPGAHFPQARVSL